LFVSENVGGKTLVEKSLTSFFRNGELITGVGFYSKGIDTNLGSVRLQLFKLSNEERFKFLWDQYLIGSNGVLMMYDITHSNSLNKITEFIQKVKNRLRSVPILLVGNKLDLEEKREVSKEEVDKFKEKHDISFSMEISLKTGENVEEMFMKLAEMIFMRWKESLNQ